MRTGARHLHLAVALDPARRLGLRALLVHHNGSLVQFCAAVPSSGAESRLALINLHFTLPLTFQFRFIEGHGRPDLGPRAHSTAIVILRAAAAIIWLTIKQLIEIDPIKRRPLLLLLRGNALL